METNYLEEIISIEIKGGKRNLYTIPIYFLPSLQESKRKANSSTNSLVINLCLKAGTSATLPSNPIMFLSRSAFSGKRSWIRQRQLEEATLTMSPYFTLKEEIHAATIEEPLTVDGGLVCHVPHGGPGRLHHIIAHLVHGNNDRNVWSSSCLSDSLLAVTCQWWWATSSPWPPGCPPASSAAHLPGMQDCWGGRCRPAGWSCSPRWCALTQCEVRSSPGKRITNKTS